VVVGAPPLRLLKRAPKFWALAPKRKKATVRSCMIALRNAGRPALLRFLRLTTKSVISLAETLFP
jgi:hypothetical protein